MEEAYQTHRDLGGEGRHLAGFLASRSVGLEGMSHICHLEAEGACHSDHMDHGDEAEARNHERDNLVDHHPVGSSQGGRKGEVEAEEAEDLSFCSHHSHGA